MNQNLNINSIIVKTIKVVVTTLIGFSLFIGCEDANEVESIEFELNTRLTEDANGYYHLTIDTTNWQTLHRIEARVTRNGEGVNIIKFGWTSNFFWYVGDTLGYVIENTGNDELWYVGYDTTYLTWYGGFEVPIINSSSYSDFDGYVNTMIAPVKTMVGDTATIYYGFYDNWRYEDVYGEFNIIFD